MGTGSVWVLCRPLHCGAVPGRSHNTCVPKGTGRCVDTASCPAQPCPAFPTAPPAFPGDASKVPASGFRKAKGPVSCLWPSRPRPAVPPASSFSSRPHWHLDHRCPDTSLHTAQAILTTLHAASTAHTPSGSTSTRHPRSRGAGKGKKILCLCLFSIVLSFSYILKCALHRYHSL